MSRVQTVTARDVVVGDVIACPNGDSITVESIRLDGDMIEFAGTQTSHNFLGDESGGTGFYGAFPDSPVAVVRR